MRTTAAANRWLQMFAKWYSVRALVPVVDKAREIARERGAKVLGKVHLEAALETLAEGSDNERR